MSFIWSYFQRRNRSTNASSDATPVPDMKLKPLTGRFDVGFVDVEWEDAAELLSNGSNDTDETHLLGDKLPFVLARIYYPVERGNDDTRELGTWLPSSQYFPGYGYFLRIPRLVSSGIGRLLAADVHIQAHEGPALASISALQQERFPVAFFSHGLAGIRTTYSTLCCEMASRGIVVLALEHRDGSAAMTIDQKGRVFPYRAGPSGLTLPMVDYTYRAAQMRHRLHEMHSAVRFMRRLDDAGDCDRLVSPHPKQQLSMFRGRLLTERLIMLGHSFGAGTCLAASQQIPAVSCCIAWDPWMFPMPQPQLQISRRNLDLLVVLNEKFSWPENDVAIHRHLQDMRNDSHLLGQVCMRGSGHMDQSDLASIVPARIIRLLRPGSSIPRDPHSVLQANVDLAAAHLAAAFPFFNFEHKWSLVQLEERNRRADNNAARSTVNGVARGAVSGVARSADNRAVSGADSQTVGGTATGAGNESAHGAANTAVYGAAPQDATLQTPVSPIPQDNMPSYVSLPLSSSPAPTQLPKDAPCESIIHVEMLLNYK